MPVSGRFTYVYILQSELDPDRFYVGCARDLRQRITYHNQGRVRHTMKWRPWRIKTYGRVFRSQPGEMLRTLPQIRIGPRVQQEIFVKRERDEGRLRRAVQSRKDQKRNNKPGILRCLVDMAVSWRLRYHRPHTALE